MRDYKASILANFYKLLMTKAKNINKWHCKGI